MNVKRYIAASLAVFVAAVVLDYVIQAVILKSAYEATQSVWRPGRGLQSVDHRACGPHHRIPLHVHLREGLRRQGDGWSERRVQKEFTIVLTQTRNGRRIV